MTSALLRCLFIFAFLLIFAACGTGGTEKPLASPAADTVTAPTAVAEKTADVRNRMSDQMLAQLIGYYEKLYANDSVGMKILRSDTLVELRFADTTGGPDSYSGTLFLASISTGSGVNPALSGDLNNDGLADQLVSVHTEGGGGGGNVWWDDHFVFLADGAGGFTLADSEGDAELIDASGYFFPESISSGIVGGVSNEYAEDDGHCCPSLYFRIKLRLESGKLVQVSKTGIPKPKN